MLFIRLLDNSSNSLYNVCLATNYTLGEKLNYKILFVLLQVVCILTASFADESNKDIALDCKMKGGGSTLFIINPDKKQSKLILPDSAVLGKLEATKEHYMLIFPRTDERWETHVTIQRYTGALVWEHGGPPFGEDSLKNVHRFGKCEQRKAEPKL